MENSHEVMDISNSGLPLEEKVIQSPNDKRKYRVIVLANGLKALLISDIDADAETSTSSESENHQKEAKENTNVDEVGKAEAEESEDSGSDGSEHEGTDEDSDISDMELERPVSKSKKQGKEDDSEKLAAAALCVGVGSFCDPSDVPGLAHFLEHMVFMGSTKYPDENAFDSFIKKHGGNSNAFTDCERTVYYFDVERKSFRNSLDIFAQFFIDPLMKRDSVDREIKAVDSEFDMSKTSDTVRKQQLLGSLARSSSPMAKFMWGNVESLKLTPSSQGIDLYKKLQEFHDKYYSAHFMTLAVQARESLDTLEAWVKEIFASVPNNHQLSPTFTHEPSCFDTAVFHKLYEVVPVKNVHQLEITWHLPCLKHLYKSKPLHYVGWLVGHEGTGSILSFLRKCLWALSISAGNGESGWEHNSTGALFVINISLTDDGLAHVYEVMTAVFEYLAMLRNVGPSETVYNEIKVIEDNEFRWKEQVDPSDYVEHLVEAMQVYEPADYLRGDSVLDDYCPQAENGIKQVLCALVPGKCNIALLSRNFDDESIQLKEEFWYKTKYNVKDIPVEYLDKWSSLTPPSHLHLPLSNDYIASDFSLRDSLTAYNKEPKLVLNNARSRLWFKQDKKFKVPKSYIYFEITSPVVGANAKTQAMFDLFISVLSHNLQEVAYNAHVAQLEYEFKSTSNGLVIKLNGFGHKLLKLFQTIVDHIDNFDVSDELFHTLNEQLKKDYFNNFIKAGKLANNIRLMLLEHNSWTRVHRRSFLMNLQKTDLQAFVSEFRTMSFMEGYVHGNYTLEEVLEIEQYIRCQLSSDILPLSMLPVERISQIPSADSAVRVRSFNEGDANSSVVNYYQVGPTNIKGSVTNELLNMMMEEPCFDVLRTREQLGYFVYSAAKNTSGIVGIAVSVETQASKFSVTQVDDKIEAFLVEFRDKLDSCTENEFNGQRQSLISIKQCDDSHMGEEADRLWGEIRDKTYLFDRLDKEVDELEKLKLDDVRLWFLNTLDKNEAKLRKKLSVQVVGFGENETDSVMESEPFSTLSLSNTVDLSLCQETPYCPNTKRKHNNSTSATSADADTTFDFQYLEMEQSGSGERMIINDLSKYKCSLPLYPVSNIL